MSPERARRDAWFAARGWRAMGFQDAVADAMAAGRSGLLHAGTGAGKTYAAWFGALERSGAAAKRARAGPAVLWVTPMRALAQDTGRALAAPLAAVAPAWKVAVRTGDTSAAERARQERSAPQALVTTPESLSLVLTRADAAERLGRVRAVVVDEWHELMGNKRGVQVQLALARLRRWCPGLVVWGLSATLADLDGARAALLGADAQAGEIVRAGGSGPVRVDTLVPSTVERFPWAGHLGLVLLPRVVDEIEAAASSLVFTNTRAQAELWYQALLEARPDWAGEIALHHGSLDRRLRDFVEAGLKEGRLRAVVCTSSLDLGVDFLPVERVLQIGSPKGVARLAQRAGRSGHAPGRTSRLTCVPTHALEMLEAAAARAALAAGGIEARQPPERPLDVLVQHLVTVALGGGFEPDSLYEEVRSTHAYRDLDAHAWQWCLDFVTRGGRALGAYPEYCRVGVDADGRHVVRDPAIARRHRMSVGTIVGDPAVDVRYLRGGRIGSVEESFVGRLRPGECFLFAGRLLELVRLYEMTAWVRKATGSRPAVPRWQGGRMPLSSRLADAVLALLGRIAQGDPEVLEQPEIAALGPLLQLQARWSRLPAPGVLVIETVRTREGRHLFVYPFAGRLVHAALARLVAWRAARPGPATFSMAVNDYGFELVSSHAFDWAALIRDGLFEPRGADEDLARSLDTGELAKRRFREIARVAGLVFQGYPGAPVPARHLQASAGLLYDVFARHDPDNRLLGQAMAEALAQELEHDRLGAVLAAMAGCEPVFAQPPRPTPFGFPLIVERMRERLSSETLAERVARMLREAERAAG